MKNKLLGHVKTKHFKERQKERAQRDRLVKEAITKGELRERDGSLIYSYKDIEVVANDEEELLITIIKKDSEPTGKLLSKERAKAIKAALEKLPDPPPEIRAEIRAEIGPETEPEIEKELEVDLESYLTGKFFKKD